MIQFLCQCRIFMANAEGAKRQLFCSFDGFKKYKSNIQGFWRFVWSTKTSVFKKIGVRKLFLPHQMKINIPRRLSFVLYNILQCAQCTKKDVSLYEILWHQNTQSFFALADRCVSWRALTKRINGWKAPLELRHHSIHATVTHFIVTWILKHKTSPS